MAISNHERVMQCCECTVFDARILAIHSARVNVKSLAEEARIIRRETRRAGQRYRNALARHRRGRLREEARYAHLALAFIRGRPYKVAENAAKEAPQFKRLWEKVKRHWWEAKEHDVTKWLGA